MNIDCPKCQEEQELDCDDLPKLACDSQDYECRNARCNHTFSVGWSAEAEVRNDYLDKEPDAPI